ncbi:FG-GAP repeat domain-containing protein [Streptomyces yaizuensis]|uniref:VCBS repeat-containing protein n=1 Tax=Streptomyces yaizuensis TaxID=2989713 RepID=A0ABQ5NTM7_9ACTN|nr:VCBS repeat-containing protein [Streptomyces sp. YSPA8]GLF93607.1 VCBS repeat-containing protein [Streptomyces sp. YSPA8]
MPSQQQGARRRTGIASRRALTPAIAAGLALTAGPLAVPAGAAPEPRPTATAEKAATAEKGGKGAARAAASFGPGSEVVSAGASGYTTVDAQGRHHWHEDSSAGAPVPIDPAYAPALLSDSVVSVQGSVVRLRNPAPDSPTVEIDLAAPGRGYDYIGVATETVIARQGTVVRLLQPSGGTVSDRPVTGLPADAESFRLVSATDGNVLLQYSTGPAGSVRWHLAVINRDTDTLTDTFPVASPQGQRAAAVSGTHVAWMEPGASPDAMTLVIAERGSASPPQRHALTGIPEPLLGLAGDQVVYANSTPLDQGSADDPHLALTARSIAGGQTWKLLDHATTLVPGIDDALLVMGGRVPGQDFGGEGVYTVLGTRGAGDPVAQLRRATGEPTEVQSYDQSINPNPALDRNNGRVPLEWLVTRTNVNATLTIRGSRFSGLPHGDWTVELDPQRGDSAGPGRLNYTWPGLLRDADGREFAPPAGTTDWSITIRPDNGIGAPLTTRGSFGIGYRDDPRSYFVANGSPDLLAHDRSGGLWYEDTYHDPRKSTFEGRGRQRVNGYWKGYDRVVPAGDLNSGRWEPELLTRDTSGVLWLHPGTREPGSFGPRVRVGGGWNIFDQLAGGRDLTGDGKRDLVALDKAGEVWLYRGTGNLTAPFTPRTKVISGAQPYDRLVSAGDLNGDTAADLLTRDRSGVLWLHQGIGTGTFAPRVRVGGGWNVFTHIVGIGDGNRDGRADLYGFGPAPAGGAGSAGWFYEGTGTASAPFKARKSTPVLNQLPESYREVS